MKVLALDMATATGWALGEDFRLLDSGTEHFDLRRGESPGMRFLRFRAWVSGMIGGPSTYLRPDLVVYEQAHYRGGAATELCVGFVTRAIERAAEMGIEYHGVHTAELKKHMTGRGNAKKPDMMHAAEARFGKQPRDDDEADALCLLGYAFDHFGGRK